MIEFVDKVTVTLVDVLASDSMVAMAAWVSFDMDNEERLDDRLGVEKLINFLYRNRHMSPFEHGTFIFRVDVPIFVAREWHRHRTMSYNEVSGRYTEMKPRFYVPPRKRPLIQEGKPGDYYFVDGTDEQYAIVRNDIMEASADAWTRYQHMLEYGIAKEVARDVLPLNLMTQFYVTVNPRNLMQFLSLRNDSHALYEIRSAAKQMDEIFEEQMPLTHKAFKKYKVTAVEEARVEEKEIYPKIPASGGLVEYDPDKPIYTINIDTVRHGNTDIEPMLDQLKRMNKIGRNSN